MWRDNGHRDEAMKFIKRITENPGDGLHRLIFADWLDENGYTSAAHGQRWAAKHGKAPARPVGDANFSGWAQAPWRSHSYGPPRWRHTSHSQDPHTSAPHYLPEEFRLLDYTPIPQSSYHRDYGIPVRYTANHPVFTHREDNPMQHEQNFLSASHDLFWNESGEPENSQKDVDDHNKRLRDRAKAAEVEGYRQQRLATAKAKRERGAAEKASRPGLFDDV
jgi:uncharacterized protein (TIGR02996 family)